MTDTTFTQEQIIQAVRDYAAHHEVEIDAVEVSTTTDEETGAVVGFRLSLDVDGRSHGCDETYGEWQ